MVVVRLDESAASATTRLCRGDTVELELPELPSTGYRWRTSVPDGLSQVAVREADETTGLAEGKTGAPGDGGRRRLAFDVVEAGRHELLAELVRPWESAPRRSITFIVQASDPS